VAIHDSRVAKNAASSFPALDALLLLFTLNLTLQPLVEPDFGWHLRAGLDLIRQGWRLPPTDPYSHTMPDWPWVEHAWLTDGLIAAIYQGLGPVGPLGVILLFAAVTLGACWAAAGPAETGRTQKLVAVAVVLWVALPFLGARTQLVTLLGTALALRSVHHARSTGRGRWWVLPPLFLLWANLHGGFTAGLFLLGLILSASATMRWIVSRQPRLEDRLDEPVMPCREIGRFAVALAASALVTLINPYGWRLYAEISASLSDRFMIQVLHEWQPVSLQSRAGLVYVAYVLGLGLIGFCCYRRVEPVRWTVLLVFLGLSLQHWRNVPLFLIVSLPWCAEQVAAVAERAARFAPAAGSRPKAWLLAATAVVGLMMGLAGPEHLQRVALSGLDSGEFFRQTDYPIEAVQWVQTHRDQVGTRLYNDYGYGGFLLWWLPEERIFIDGRMPAWRIGDRWIFYDYVALTNWDPPALGVLDKYRVDWALVRRGSPLDQALRREAGWRPVYEDAKAVIYVRR
jgi:hypothetical protein